MHWNHRVYKRTYPNGEVFYQIHEAFYETKESEPPESYTTEPKALMEESVEELRETLQRMLKCLDAPVLDYKEDQ